MHRRGLAFLAAGALALAAIAGASGARSTNRISVRMTFSGAYKGSVSLTHAQDAIDYACIQWTLPGKPLRYATIFGDFAAKTMLVLKFDYDASALGRARRLTARRLVGLIVGPPDNMLWSADGRATVIATLARDLRSGSFVARNLVTSPPTTRRLHVSGSWRCASVQRRTH